MLTMTLLYWVLELSVVDIRAILGLRLGLRQLIIEDLDWGCMFNVGATSALLHTVGVLESQTLLHKWYNFLLAY